MDQRIENMESTTFDGRRFTRKQIASIQYTVARFSALSLRELTHTICEHLQWQTPKGENKIQSCLNLLDSLEKLGILSLPEKDKSRKRGPQKKIIWTSQTDEQPAIDNALKQLMPINLQVITEKETVSEWNETVDRYHYLGYKNPIGPHLRYFILDKQGRKLGCLMFAYATKSLPCRDQWIGWQEIKYKKHLDLIVNNNRFLVLPWVKVKNLASKVLSIAAHQLADDWETRYGYRPVLMETFIDLTKFNATCYQAANWHYLGHSKSKTPKGIYIYPLVSNAKSILIHGQPKPSKRQAKFRPKAVTPGDSFVHLWKNIIGTVASVANDFDLQWQKRKRVLNSLLIILFIFRLVFSKNKQGYAITIAELWDQCHILDIPLPQSRPVAASAFCNARAKLNEDIFKILHAEILQRYDRTDTDKRWKTHRIFAVDGSKINLPRQLIGQGYRTPSDNAHYPQGLLSCLYQLKSKIPIDFDLAAHTDERKMALRHLNSLSENDVVIYDRGYFSYVMLYAHIRQNVHPVFRLRAKAHGVVDTFIANDETDKVVNIVPNKKNKLIILEKYADNNCKLLALRLVKYTVCGTTYILGTTLFNQQYTIKDLSDVYHARWGIEELYKISKNLMVVEDFHGQTERGVKQELFAHFVLITLTRIFSNHSETGFNSQTAHDSDQPTIKANFKNCLITVARNIEGLLLRQSTILVETINHIMVSIFSCRQKIRPNRSYERRSRKPIGKWKPPKLAKPINEAPAIIQ